MGAPLLMMLLLLRIIILATILIYIRAGVTIYQKRNELQNMSRHDHQPPALTSDASTRTAGTSKTWTDEDGDNKNTNSRRTAEITVTTQISTTEDADKVASQLQSLGLHGIYNSNEDRYFVSVSSGKYAGRYRDGSRAGSGGDMDHDYHGGHPPDTRAGSVSVSAGQKRSELNRAAWSYTKCAALFFTALLVTWIPSSANRVYAFVHGNKSLLALELMSALVLPLQGFWNAVIYAVTSWTACKGVWATVSSAGGRAVDRVLLRRGGGGGIMTKNGAGSTPGARQHRGYRLDSVPPSQRRSDDVTLGESDSMRELAGESGTPAPSRQDT